MPERESVVTDRIAAELVSVRWPEPAEIRRRARRRSQRSAVVGPLLVVAMLASVLYAGNRPGHGPQPTATGPTPVSTVSTVPEEALLAPLDLRARSGLTRQAPVPRGTVQLADSALRSCASTRGLPRLEAPGGAWTQFAVSARQPAGPYWNRLYVRQSVYRLAPEFTERLLGDLDQLVAACDGFTVRIDRWVRGDTEEGHVEELTNSYTISHPQVAGRPAVLLWHTTATRRVGTDLPAPPAYTDRSLVVRVGVLVTELEVGETVSDEELLRLGAVATRRLCAAVGERC